MRERDRQTDRQTDRERERETERERESSCPMESIQRGGAEYNSLGGEEIQWCKSNTLSLIHIYIYIYIY